jgi:uncharacterized protein YyaL (SSP411 family)
MIPHFEKMLYDNGPLLALCCDAWQITGDALFRDAATATADWVMAEMQSPEGGYYSSLDADSEGEEGRFYVWDRAEVAALLDARRVRADRAVYGLDQPPNFEGKWHLHGYRTLADPCRRAGLDAEQARALLAAAKAKLLAARAARAPGPRREGPDLWNALMIKGMARAARVLGAPTMLASAERALDFIRARLWRDGRLLATYKDGKAHLNAYLDDYALLLDALLELLADALAPGRSGLAMRWRRCCWRSSSTRTGRLLLHRRRPRGPDQRPKPLGDESMPSGNGVAAHALQRLGHLLGEPAIWTPRRRRCASPPSPCAASPMPMRAC